MARKDPVDDYGRVLDIGFVGVDAAQRIHARDSVALERARAAVREREVQRVAAKHEAKDRTAEARAAAEQQKTVLAAAESRANRSRVEAVKTDTRHASVHGIVVTAKAMELDVIALADGDKPIARGRTDERGYFQLSIPIDAATHSAVRTKLPVLENAATVAAVRLVVSRGEKQLARDADTFAVRPGRVIYREIMVESGR